MRSLARVLFAGRSAEATLQGVALLAQETIPGCDAASVTVMEGGHPRTTVSTAEVAAAIDRHQFEGVAQERVSSDAAFDILRRASPRRNRKLHDLAAEIVGRRSPGGAAPDTGARPGSRVGS